MQLLRIGDNLVNERFFYGIVSYDEKGYFDEEKKVVHYDCILEARYMMGGDQHAQVVGGYKYTSDDTSSTGRVGAMHKEALAEAMKSMEVANA